VSCPFCQLDSKRIVSEHEGFYVIRDGYPVTKGHSLVIPRRHIGRFAELSNAEAAALPLVIQAAMDGLTAEYGPLDFNIGINDGKLAGQTIGHLHVHVIPRRSGDADDPRGGVRWVIPSKAAYWAGMEEPGDDN
jgi:diadenosine tetraphosphate (Ap4A) HIT family hydrolase